MCKYIFVKYAGDKQQAKNTGGAIFSTDCGNTVYGLELTNHSSPLSAVAKRTERYQRISCAA
jgi:hypothetical protein